MKELTDEYARMAEQYAAEYASRSMKRILDACKEGTNLDEAERTIREIYINNREQLRDSYRHVFDKHLSNQLEVKHDREPRLICFSGPFGAGKTTLQQKLDIGDIPNALQDSEVIKTYISSDTFKFDFNWAWMETGLYDPDKHQETFPYVRAAGAGAKDAAMELAVAQKSDLVYPSSLTPHISDGPQTLNSEKDRLLGYKNEGYEIIIIGCAANSNTCLERIASRDRKLSTEEVVKSVEGFFQHYLDFMAISDQSILLDTGFSKGNYATLDPIELCGLDTTNQFQGDSK